MNGAFWVGTGAIMGFVSVALGAFGAHGLKDQLTEQSLAWWKTAVEYQMFHASGLILWGMFCLWNSQFRGATLSSLPGWFFLAGIFLFSGSLYGMALTQVRTLGAITPLGGVAFLVAWMWFAYSAFRP